MRTKVFLLTIAATVVSTLGGCGESERSPGPTNGTTVSTSQQQGGTTQQAVKGPTSAPDLVSVRNFREGPTTPQGEPTTLVDFEFDRAAYITGSNRTSFHLVPKDGGDTLDAADIVPEKDEEGDKVITTAFTGKLSPKDFARGFVDKEVLSPDKAGNGPTNVGHSESIAGTGTSSPDLKSVTKDADQMLFEFDQPLTKDDVVQNTGGAQDLLPQNKQQRPPAGRRDLRKKNE